MLHYASLSASRWLIYEPLHKMLVVARLARPGERPRRDNTDAFMAVKAPEGLMIIAAEYPVLRPTAKWRRTFDEIPRVVCVVGTGMLTHNPPPPHARQMKPARANILKNIDAAHFISK